MSSSTDSPIKRVAYIAVAIGLVALVSASTAKLIRSNDKEATSGKREALWDEREETTPAEVEIEIEAPQQSTAPELAIRNEELWDEIKDPIAIVPKGVPNSFADLAEDVSPAVVNIQVIVTNANRYGVAPQYRDFHGFPFESPGNGFGGESRGEGTGFVISSSGYIVTNGHVIDGASKIEVELLNGKKYDAQIVGIDEKTDIALIKVDVDAPLQTIPLGDSDQVRPGEWVVAIGNAMSLEHSVTAGIVSAKHRYLSRGSYDDFIQTDAAINPGNSGGPLINLAGEVIGINTAINPQANTIGFAVPINMAKQILPQLHATGHVKRSWLGVEIRELTQVMKEETGSDHGALVRQVLPATPALRAGIQSGDVIVTFDGQRVESHRQLPAIVSSAPMDREIAVVIIRDKEPTQIEVTLTAMEEPETQYSRRRSPLEPAPQPAATLEVYGLDAQDMTPELAEQLELDDDNGVIVTQVMLNSAAAIAGLQRGDVILEVEGGEVNSRTELNISLDEAGDGAVLLVRREHATLYIPIKRAG
ncbi:MAG: Do family serine endopeptidase [bacterium]|jgi:serine protease Do